MLRLIIIVFIVFFHRPFAYGKIVSDAVYSNLRVGPHFIRRSLPGKRTETITAYSLSYLHPIYRRLRWEVDLFHAPDVERRSRQLKVRQDWRAFALGLDVSYPMLFRWNAGLALMALEQQTRTGFSNELGQQSRRQAKREWLPRFRWGLDYAVTEAFEIASYWLYWHRRSVDRVDWSWGLGFSYNFATLPRREAPKQDKLP